MKNESMESKIAEAFHSVTPDIRETLLSELNKAEKGVIPMNNETRPGRQKKHWVRYAALAASLMLMLGLGFGVKMISTRNATPDACVMIDVNPSVELFVNRKDVVVSAEALNPDSKKLLAEMGLTGTNVNAAVDTLIGAMVKQGYLNELTNSVLITVESEDSSRSLSLQEALSAEARNSMRNSGLEGAILSQALEHGEEQTAKRYGVSPGKAQLIDRLSAANPSYDIDGLSALSINELCLLYGRNAVEDIHATGQSSDKAYIGKEAAEEIALRHSGISRTDAVMLETELEYENGGLVYEVEFKAGQKEYEYHVSAITGEVLKYEIEARENDADDDDNKPTAPGGQNHSGSGSGHQTPPSDPAPADPVLISSNKALKIALEHAGADRSNVTRIEVELDREHGTLVYEVEFKFNGYEYDYEIDAATGRILNHKSEPDD